MDIVRALLPQDVTALFRSDEAAEMAIAAATPFFEPDFECAFIQPAEASSATGFTGLRRLWLEWLEPWEAYRTEIDDVIDLGDRVAVLSTDYGRRAGMDLEVPFQGVSIYSFRSGKIARVEFHFDPSTGLDAAGLSAADE